MCAVVDPDHLSWAEIRVVDREQGVVGRRKTAVNREEVVGFLDVSTEVDWGRYHLLAVVAIQVWVLSMFVRAEHD